MNTLETKPIILDPSQKAVSKRLERLIHDSIVVEEYEEQLKELFTVRHPASKFNPTSVKLEITQFLQSRAKKRPLSKEGRWIYYPWSKCLVHLLAPNEYFELRTARNRNLITEKEQKKFKKYKIGVVGLSVGNSAVLTLALEGAENLRLADLDILSLSNLNRIRAGIENIGENKTTLAARQIYELNPYAKLTLFSKGIEKNLNQFMSGLDIIVDEIDDVFMKIKLRLSAKKRQIPVVSAADNGDNSIVDIERFDLEPKRPIYHGLLKKINLNEIKHYNPAQRIDLINKMVGMRYVTKRMKDSLSLVGKKIYSWPQLGGAASLSGSAVVYAVRRIALGQRMLSGKYSISLDRIFGNKD